MGLCILHPEDSSRNKATCGTILPDAPRMKIPKPRTHPNRKKRSHSSPRKVSNSPKPQVSNNLVMGQVKILKRGEQLTVTTPDLKPDTETVEKALSSTLTFPEKVNGAYAGYSISVQSPPPSAIPLPVFITKRVAAVNHATSELRQMLRL